jgi:ABC-type antimicrobial peptide transport system permease subunit
MDEMNYDKFHENIDQLFCIIEKQEYSEGQKLYTNNTPFALKDELQNKYPEVLNVTRTLWIGNRPMSYEQKVFTVGPIAMVDPEFLSVFTFNILKGDPNALEDPDKIMITNEIAEVFFGNVDPIGNTLKMDDQYEFEVGAVLENVPDNSTFKFKILVPFVQMEKIFERDLNSWGNNWPRTTVFLKEGTSVELFQKKIENLCKDNGQENTTLFTKPFVKDHLYSDSGDNNQVQYIYLFIAIGIIILLIACVNFVNLSTARSETRAQEVGIRKVVGAHRSNLIFQFLSEKILLVFISLILAAVIAYLLIPMFNEISGKNILFDIFRNRSLMLLFLGTGVITTLLSGIYPAVILSSFSPVRALKSTVMVKSKKQVKFRSILVIIQFTLSIILIVSAIVVLSQLKYIKNFSLGYKSENLIYIELQGQAKQNHIPFTNEILKIPGVINLTKADKPPFWSGNSSWGFDWEEKDPNVKVLINMMWVDKNYFTVLEIPFVDGSSFSDRFDNYEIDKIENLDVILNAEAIRRMKLNEPVGKYFGLGDFKATIVGVTKDFNFESLKRTVEPLLLLPLQDDPNVFIVRIQAENIRQTIDNVELVWKKINPVSPFIFGFFDDRLEQMYQSEVRISKLFKYFTAIALFIACLGLLGLSSYSIQRRTKEIGVRKVVGASVRQVVLLLSKEFTRWIFISFLIACPVSWYVMNMWLQNFAYKTVLYWWIFVVAGLMALLIAIITVGFQTINAALKNPVDSLRYE